MIGVVTTSYPRSPADPAGHFVRGFCEWLAAHVGPVEVVAMDAAADPRRRLAEGGLSHRLRGARGLVEAAAITARLTAAVRRRAHRWDAIVSHWLLPCGLVADTIARGRRHLAIAHGTDVALLRRWPGGATLARRLARRADLVYVTEALRIAGAPGRVVPMPALRGAGPASASERAAARARLELPPVGEGPRVVLFVGRMVPDKGVDLLVDALPPGVLALVVGDGPSRPAATASVRVLGPRFGAALRACYAAADLLVVPSRRDGSPTVIAEAQDAGTPVLGTTVGGIPAAVGAGGLCVAPTVAALRHAIASFTGDRQPPRLQIAPSGWSERGPLLWGSAGVVNTVRPYEIREFYY